MGWGNSIAARVFFSGNYFPKYVDIPKFCDVVGNSIMILWLLKNRRHPEILKPDPLDALGLLKSMGGLLKEMSDVSAKAQDALQDWDISKNEARGIIRELHDILEVSCYVMGRLEAVSANKNDFVRGGERK